MPYEGEFATSRPLLRFSNSAAVERFFGKMDPTLARSQIVKPLQESAASASTWLPDYVVAVDGSSQEHSYEQGFPGAEFAYLTVVSVILKIAEMRKYDAHRPIDPKIWRSLQDCQAIDAVLPGSNMPMRDGEHCRAAFREFLFETFKQNGMVTGGRSILDTYEDLFSYRLREPSRPQQCPLDDCPTRTKDNPGLPYIREKGCYSCACPEKREFFSTDALRIHEGMNLTGPSGEMFSDTRSVLEHVWMLHVIEELLATKVREIGQIAFVMDGPLALFHYQAWLSQAIRKRLTALNKAHNELTGQDILLLGVEKTGAFVDHLARLDRKPNGAPGRLPNGWVMLLDNEYIRKNIVTGEKVHGLDTYYGRKFFYKTATGALIVGMLPVLSVADGNAREAELERAEPDQYPRLADALSILDQMVSSRYPNAIIPLIAAHAEAAIPMNLGKRVLAELAKKLMRRDLS